SASDEVEVDGALAVGATAGRFVAADRVGLEEAQFSRRDALEIEVDGNLVLVDALRRQVRIALGRVEASAGERRVDGNAVDARVAGAGERDGALRTIGALRDHELQIGGHRCRRRALVAARIAGAARAQREGSRDVLGRRVRTAYGDR